jgi:hypothetical protein
MLGERAMESNAEPERVNAANAVHHGFHRGVGWLGGDRRRRVTLLEELAEGLVPLCDGVDGFRLG